MREGAAVCVHVFFEIFVHVFEYEHEFLVCVDDVAEVDYVVVFEFFHEGNFTDGSGGCSFLIVEVDFF